MYSHVFSGATRSNEGTETLFARQRFVTCCKAFNLQAIDSVYIDIPDIEGLRKQSLEGMSENPKFQSYVFNLTYLGKAWGFDGKQSIHPTQVPIIQDAFLPPTERVQWAKELIDEFVKHEQSGKGAFTFKGSMIDRPLLLQAMNIVQTVKFVEDLKE